MRRQPLIPRKDWKERAAALDFAFAEIAGEPYWDETAAYVFTSAEIDCLDDATAEIERVCREACDHAVTHDRNATLGIPQSVWPLVKNSWKCQEPSLYGRLDLCWDGTGPPKLLEYNADTPTALYEAAVIQWEWLTIVQPGADQFNSLHEALIAAWKAFRVETPVHFSAIRDHTEDRLTVDYLRDTAIQAGLTTSFLNIEDIGWNGHRFTDLQDKPIETIFKLYPWDWLLKDSFGRNIASAPTRWIEPAWRLMPASKGMLALLWELFPDHPNLLPAFRDPSRIAAMQVKKPLFGREGANIETPFQSTTGTYGDEGFVWQQYQELPHFEGRYPVIGSWLIAGEPHGMGIREDKTPITQDTSRFVPHYFLPGP
jgi:glutathionylspermidine synthase